MNLYFLPAGVAIGIVLLIAVSFIPFTKIAFGLMSIVPESGGTRLYLFGIHIHHYVFGVILIGLSAFAYFKWPNVALLLVGLGAVLIIDQLPMILGFTPFGESFLQSLVK